MYCVILIVLNSFEEILLTQFDIFLATQFKVGICHYQTKSP